MDTCNVYINEKSAISQPCDIKTVEDYIISLLDCLALLDNCKKEVVKIQKYYCSSIFLASLSNDVSLQSLSNKDLKRKFKLALKNAIKWELSPLTKENTTYLHNSMDVSGSSMSEAYENIFPLLINFPKSSISEPIAVIINNKDGKKEVESLSNSSEVAKKLIEKGWKNNAYDLSSKNPPRDEESILADLEKFEPTEHRYNGRLMYRRKETDHLCYIDRKHTGAAAHIEEFNETTKNPVCTLKINEDSIHHALTPNEKTRKLRFDNEK